MPSSLFNKIEELVEQMGKNPFSMFMLEWMRVEEAKREAAETMTKALWEAIKAQGEQIQALTGIVSNVPEAQQLIAAAFGGTVDGSGRKEN